MVRILLDPKLTDGSLDSTGLFTEEAELHSPSRKYIQSSVQSVRVRSSRVMVYIFVLSSFSSHVQHKNRKAKWINCFFLCCTWLEKEDFLETLHVLSCLVQLKSVLFNLLCVLDPFSERWQTTLFQMFLVSDIVRSWRIDSRFQITLLSLPRNYTCGKIYRYYNKQISHTVCVMPFVMLVTLSILK